MNTADPIKIVYLAGAIEKAPDRGEEWRQRIESALNGKFLIINPCKTEKSFVTDEELEIVYDHNNKVVRTREYQAIMKKLIDFDLRLVKMSHVVVCLWDENCVGGGGTHGELTFHAFNCPDGERIIISEDLDIVPGWIVGTMTKHYKTIEDFLEDYK